MKVRRRGNKLERWEIALIKAMVADGRWPNDQDILAYFTRPTRSINHRAIAEIRTGAKHAAIKAATADELNGFVASWPEVDAETGLSLRGDELLIKAREAMIAAVHTFNSAGLTFRAELFIVTAIIAWTYLLHAWFKREGIDYRYAAEQNDKTHIVPTNVLRLKSEGRNLGHPCPYPEGIPEFFVRLLTKPKDVVLDPFLGSGTTAVVAKRLDRSCWGFERNPTYFSFAEKRIADTQAGTVSSQMPPEKTPENGGSR